MSTPTLILNLEVQQESDMVLARQRVRQVASLLGFDSLEQTRIATAASEVVRDACNLGGGSCSVACLAETETPPRLLIRIGGRGIAPETLQALAEGRPAASGSTGAATGLPGARRLMDHFGIGPNPEGKGATISLAKTLPRRPAPLGPDDLARIVEELARHTPMGPLEEVRQQNRELLRILGEVRDLQSQTVQLNRELEETNRGVVALHTELDEKANSLRRASELKTRFLSEISHEFRSPLNTISSLAGFLLDRSDGPLTAEQDKQVRFVRKAANGLSELVDDLLDLAKVEAGKTVVRPEAFTLSAFFSTLRGMVRPLMTGDTVSLTFEASAGLPPLYTDERKLTQILRNFLTNALKFTERGEVRVSATAGPEDSVVFSVTDSGIGIAAADLRRIFEEFSQVDGPIQSRVKGTGLGLPLSRRMAEVLGGGVSVRSDPGVGSTFVVTVPRIFRAPEGPQEEAIHVVPRLDPTLAPVLVVEDDPATLYLYERYLKGSGFQVLPATSIAEARRQLAEVRPAAILLDILLEAESGWSLLDELRRREETRAIPILVLTIVEGQERALALGADEFCLKPVGRSWLLERLGTLCPRDRGDRVLIVDDDEADRYLLARQLRDLGYGVLEARSGTEGLARARDDHPRAILLDLVMPDLTGFQVLDQLKSDPSTALIPVLIHSANSLDDDQRRRLEATTSAILTKGEVSRKTALQRLREALEGAGLRSIPAQEVHGV